MTTDVDLRKLLRDSYEELKRSRAKIAALEGQQREPIAIVSMACRFPGNVQTPADLWRALLGGLRPAGERTRGPTGAAPGAPCSFIEDIEGFDPAFFEMSPRE